MEKLRTKYSLLCARPTIKYCKNSHTFLSTTISQTFECASISRQTDIQAQNYAATLATTLPI